MSWGGKSERLPWLGVVVAATALVTSSVLIVLSVDAGQQPPFVDPDFVPGPEPAAFDDDALHLAGSGSNLPLTRALARAYGSSAPIIHPSIGSVGGIRALLDDAIGMALIARPLLPEEREQGLVATPYARIPVVVAAHNDVPQRSIDTAELVEMFAGRRTQWNNGTPVVVLQRQPGDSSHAVFDAAIPGFAEANETAYAQSLWHVIHHHGGMEDALANTRGAIGVHAGAVPADADIKVLAVDGVQPSPEAVASGTYRYTKVLSLVTKGPPTGEAKAFVEFATSAVGAATIEAGGGVPLGGRDAE